MVDGVRLTQAADNGQSGDFYVVYKDNTEKTTDETYATATIHVPTREDYKPEGDEHHYRVPTGNYKISDSRYGVGTIVKKFKIVTEQASNSMLLAPTLNEATSTSIRLNEVTDSQVKVNYGLQLPNGSFDWRQSPLFENLEPDTEYTFALQTRGDETHTDSKPGPTAPFRTLSNIPDASDIDVHSVLTYDYDKEAIASITDGYRVFLSNVAVF